MPTAATICFTIALSVLAPAAVAATVTSDRPLLAASAKPAIANEQWNALVRYALLDDADAVIRIGEAYARGAGPHDIPEAIRWLSRAAANVPEAQRELGLLLRGDGIGVPAHESEATAWLNRSAGHGDADAMYLLSGFCADGRGVLKSPRPACRFLLDAAEQSHPQAWLALSQAQEAAREVARDNNEALTWYQLAANAGNVAAQLRLGDIARLGVLGQPRDDVLALRWYGLAADQGSAVAEEGIGDLYWQGSGDVPRNRAEAVRHYQAAATHGLASGQRNLAIAYANGDGAPGDDASMLYWGRKAAEGGDAVAAGMLGYAIMIGVDGTYDLVEAATWLTLATEHAHAGEWHNRAASYSQEARNRLTQPELAAYHARVGRLHATLGSN